MYKDDVIFYLIRLRFQGYGCEPCIVPYKCNYSSLNLLSVLCCLDTMCWTLSQGCILVFTGLRSPRKLRKVLWGGGGGIIIFPIKIFPFFFSLSPWGGKMSHFFPRKGLLSFLSEPEPADQFLLFLFSSLFPLFPPFIPLFPHFSSFYSPNPF